MPYSLFYRARYFLSTQFLRSICCGAQILPFYASDEVEHGFLLRLFNPQASKSTVYLRCMCGAFENGAREYIKGVRMCSP
eukprot:2042885-Pleurochrysis_carterae.AAC.1